MDDEVGDAATQPHHGHIAWIVAGTLIFGLLSAIALVTVVFSGATEHVIAGSVLLAFAVAWVRMTRRAPGSYATNS